LTVIVAFSAAAVAVLRVSCKPNSLNYGQIATYISLTVSGVFLSVIFLRFQFLGVERVGKNYTTVLSF